MVSENFLSLWRGSKAVEDYRSPRRWRGYTPSRQRGSVLECASPMALCHEEPEATARRHNMFTGIVEEAGRVESIKLTARSIQLTIRLAITGHGLKVGDSLAINGCCLTVAKLARRGRTVFAQFDLLKETWQRTNLQFAKPGSLVNLERPVRADGRMGGHFVTGHIDGVGTITRWERADRDHVLDISAPSELMRYIVFKGSIAVDGISLTVAGVQRRSFRIWIIPHTYKVTALQERKVSDSVNLEADLLGKYVEKFATQSRRPPNL
jgi:riboflavin synthase